MMCERFQIQSIYLYRQPVDMRKGMGGLSSLVRAEFDLDTMAPSLFVFTNRDRDKIKLLLWELNGFYDCSTETSSSDK
jgi:transposase